MCSAPSAIRLASAVIATSLLIVAAGCSSEEESADEVATSSTTTTAPIPTPGGLDIADYDACAQFDDAARGYLEAVGGAEVERVTGDASNLASVCGWFLVGTPGDDAPEESLLLRVEPVRVEGNFLCEQRPELNATPFAGDGAPDGWLAASSAPVEAASEDDTWCAYVRAPDSVDPEGESVAAATTALLSTMHEQLPR